jgi:hypothetical protein
MSNTIPADGGAMPAEGHKTRRALLGLDPRFVSPGAISPRLHGRSTARRQV